MNQTASPASATSADAAQRGLAPTVFWRIAEAIPQSLNWTLMTLSIILPLLAWGLLTSSGMIDSVFLPSPAKVVQALIDLWNRGVLSTDIAASFVRVSAGFLLAVGISIPLGIMMGAFPGIRALTEPIVGIVRYMPAPAFIPLLIIYLGIDEAPKIALIVIGTVFFNTLMIMDAVKFVPKELLETTYTLGGRRHQLLFQVITPYVIPNILDACRVNMAAAWNLVVVAELVAANDGLGKRILLAQRFLKTDEIFACLLVLGLIGFSLDLLFRWLVRATCRWSFD